VLLPRDLENFSRNFAYLFGRQKQGSDRRKVGKIPDNRKIVSDAADIVQTTAVSVLTSNISTPLPTLVSIERVHVPTQTNDEHFSHSTAHLR
jgi:hypothetical protein